MKQEKSRVDTPHPFLQKTEDTPFKDKRNQWFTRALFFEYRRPDFKPMFTLKDKDYRNYKSLKRIYMSYDHVPGYEYDFVMENLGGWEHWERLQASPDVGKHIAEWKTLKDIQIKSEAIKIIMKVARNPDSGSCVPAAKYLTDKGYLEKGAKGRPSKEEREAKLKENKQIVKELDADLKRLGIIQGGKV